MKEEKYIPEGHSDVEYITIGTIDFSDCMLTEQEIQSQIRRYNPAGLGECKIEVYPNEGQIPHFHLYKLDKSFETCICIYSNHYFAHGGKYKDTLNSKQCKALDKWLKDPNKILAAFPNNNYISNWHHICLTWATLNSDHIFPEYSKVIDQPDYTKLLNFKSE